MITAKVIKDSISNHKKRLTTLELEYPRYIHSEFMTHRVFSRNAQSSRAIPVEIGIQKVVDNPVIPIFMKNQSGMQADNQLDYEDLKEAHKEWIRASHMAIESAGELARLGVHKQIVNRLLEPFSTIKVIVTATEWDNFFSLRIHPAAQQEMQLLAIAIKEARDNSTPIKMDVGEWHLPYIYEDEEVLDLSLKKKISVARCARVSYLNHDKQLDIEKDVQRHDELLSDRHASPFEHVATPVPFNTTANFVGWSQYRTLLGL